MSRTIITAHAGCEDTTPGSMESILTALKLDVDIIEIDLSLYEGNIYLAHDSVDPNCLDTYVTFRQVLEHLSSENVKINCDLKQKEALKPALMLLREYGMEERAVFTGDYWADIDMNAKYKYFLNINSNGFRLDTNKISEKEADAIINFYNLNKDHAMDAFNLNYKIISPEAAKILDESGINICYWTVDEPEEIEKMLKRNVYALTTRKVVDAIAARDRIQR